jgi:hypothetical protein
MASAVFALLFLLSRGESSFPKIEAGVYLGKLVGIFSEEEGEVPFILTSDENFFEISILKSGWSKVIIEKPKHRDGQFRAPLEFGSQEAHLRFSGVKSKLDKSYNGEVYNLDLGMRGTWSLNPTRISKLVRPEKVRNEIKSVLALSRELNEVEKEISLVEQQLRDNKEAVARLSEFLSDAEVMNERAAAKFERVQRDFDSSSRELKIRRKEAREVAQRLALSESVTSNGILVALSRKTLDRENRWLDSIFNSAGAQSSYDLDQEVARAERINAIKTAIARARGE